MSARRSKQNTEEKTEKRENNWAPAWQALNYLKSKNIIISNASLTSYALRYKFVQKAEDGFHWEYDLNKIAECMWLFKKPDKEYIALEKAAKKYKISYPKLYRLFNINREQLTYVRQHRKIYVNEEQIKDAIRDKKDREKHITAKN